MGSRGRRLIFGTAGIPLSTRKPSYVAGLSRIRELGLGALELEFVYGVRVNRVAAVSIKEAADRLRIKLSAHSPYWINLNSRDPLIVQASRERILQSARTGSLAGARNIVFHPGFYVRCSPEQVYLTVKDNIRQVIEQIEKEALSVVLRPEVSGKIAAFGTIDELLDLSNEIPGVAPCIDMAHCHARSGGVNSYEEVSGLLKKVARRLGTQALEDVHVHISGIAYGKAGETKHINLGESDLNYQGALQALGEQGCSGLVICESPNLEEDALLLQETYYKMG